MAEKSAQGRKYEALAAALWERGERLVVDLVGEEGVDCYRCKGLSCGGFMLL